MAVRELLRGKKPGVVTIGPDASAAEAVRLLIQRNVGMLPVTRDDRVLGIVAERDFVRALDAQACDISRLTVDRVMRRPAPVCDIADPLRDVMERMTRERYRHLVVLERGRIAGVLSIGDLVKHRLDHLETEANVLRDTVAAQRFQD